MILLKKLTLTNFLSHEKTEIDFSSSEKALIDGSSGAGKSSIFDAILWALYGEGRADNRSLVRKGSKRGSVCLELRRQNEQIGGEDLVIITRSATSVGKHTLDVAIQQPDGSRAAHPLSGIRELQTWIDTDLVGASYLLFINSVAYVQGNTESFVSQTAPKRKELLLEIVKAEDYRKYYEIARQRLAELDNDRNRLSGQIIELEANLTALRGRVEGRSTHIQTISDNTKLLAEIEPKMKALEEKKAAMSALLKTVDIIEGILKDARVERDNALVTLDEKKKKISDKPRLVEMLTHVPVYQADIERVKGELTTLRSALSSASETEARRNEYFSREPKIHDYSSELKRIEEKRKILMESPVCPSGVDCPYSGDHQFLITGLDTQSQILREGQTKEILALDAWEKEGVTLPPSTDMRQSMKEIGLTEDHLKNLESELAGIQAVQKDIDAIEEIEKEVPILLAAVDEKNKKIEDLLKQKDDAERAAKIDEVNTIDNDLLSLKREQGVLNGNIARATSALENIDRDEKEMKTTEEKISEIKSAGLATIEEKVRKLGLVKEAFSSKGIETLVCDYILPKLEDKINKVLGKLSDFTIRLDTQRPSADGESTVEGLWITIINEMGQELPYEAYSGGEKVRITFAIAEAFASLGQNRIGFRLVDEAVLALDENSLESFLEVVETLLADFNQVLFISHIQEVKDMLDKHIGIVKNNGISYVKPT